MKDKNVLKTLASTLLFATSARLSLHAQAIQPYQGTVGRTLADSKEWWPEPVRAPAGAPNVVWILIDDVGFGAASTFGGLIQTPTFDTLASKWSALHELSYLRDLRPNSRSAADWPEQCIRA
jgi:arylsulfatase